MDRYNKCQTKQYTRTHKPCIRFLVGNGWRLENEYVHDEYKYLIAMSFINVEHCLGLFTVMNFTSLFGHGVVVIMEYTMGPMKAI